MIFYEQNKFNFNFFNSFRVIGCGHFPKHPPSQSQAPSKSPCRIRLKAFGEALTLKQGGGSGGGGGGGGGGLER